MTLRMSEEEYNDWIRSRNRAVTCAPPNPAQVTVGEPATQQAARNKYGNVRTEVCGIRFDSKHEAGVYTDLQARVEAGELWFILRQVRFPLPGGIVYVADFMAFTTDGRLEGVYDAKSAATKKNRVYINKKKQMKACYGIEIVEV